MAITFIKLDVNILNDTKIKIIRKMPDGDKLLTLWIGILCIGMKSSNPGLLEIGEGIAFDIDGIAAELDIPSTIVKYGLNQFTKLNMIEELDGAYYITNFEKHQNLEKITRIRELGRIRQQKHREKTKLSRVTNALQLRESREGDATDLDEDIDKDLDKISIFKTEWNKAFPDKALDEIRFNIELCKDDRSVILNSFSATEIQQAICNFKICVESVNYVSRFKTPQKFIHVMEEYINSSDPLNTKKSFNTTQDIKQDPEIKEYGTSIFDEGTT